MKNSIDNLARALVMLRGIYSIKIKDIADICGVSTTAINHHEKNKSKLSVNTFCTITKVYKITPNRLSKVMYEQKKLTNSEILICLKPKRESQTIDPKFSVSRVAKLIRLLKNIPFNVTFSNDTEFRNRITYESLNHIETLKSIPSVNTIKHICILYEISFDKYMYYAEKTANMTTVDAAMFIAKDLSM